MRVALPVIALAIAGVTVSAEEKRPDVRSKDMPLLIIDRPQPAAFRSDIVEFELAPTKSPGWRLEYKVTAKAGDALLYSLTASGPVISEFHNEMLPSKAVMFYREEAATTASHGQFISPANGAHGWYLANTTDKPVKVRLQLSGYYTLEPGLIKIKT
jgi:hypothetical protein